MRYVWIMIIVLAAMPVLAQVPTDNNQATQQQIANEHKATRKFVSDELTRQRNEFFTGIDDRANYYETTAENLLTTAVWKLGLIWFGVVLIVTGFNNFLRNKLEKRKWAKLKTALTEEVKADVLKTNTQQQQAIDQRRKDLYMRQKSLAEAKPQLDELRQQMMDNQVKMEKFMAAIYNTDNQVQP